jgi:tetratricopeptide (TPR) repeat protein
MDSDANQQPDLFIAHSQAESAWVHDHLIPALQIARDRITTPKDFRPGASQTNEIERAINSRRYTLLVLSPSYFADELSKYTEQIASHQAVTGNIDSLIPLVLRSCPLPPHIDFRVKLDFTTKDNWEAETNRLRGLLATHPRVQSTPSAARLSEKTWYGVGDNCPPLAPEYVPLADNNFVGRKDTIEAICEGSDTVHMILVLGIPGIGKTSVLKQLVPRFESDRVFWYKFEAGLISLSDILLRLARFVDALATGESHLLELIMGSGFPERVQIELIIERLNHQSHYLFFDSAHHIENNAALNGFFSLLKERLQSGAVFVASRSRPRFCTLGDEARRAVRTFHLRGLSVPDVEEFFVRNDLALSVEAIETLTHRFGGLPLALELMTALLSRDFTEEKLLALAEQVEDEAVDELFLEVYERLPVAQRGLLTTASLFTFPFSQDELLAAHRALFGRSNYQDALLKLRREFLIHRVANDLYEVHQIVRVLALKHTDDLEDIRMRLADHLAESIATDFGACIEAIMLYFQGKALDRAAELVAPLVDASLLPYYPELAEALLIGFEEDLVNPRQWVWILGSKGNLAHFWRRDDVAQAFYQGMLELAERLLDGPATAVALMRLGNLCCDHDAAAAENYYISSLRINEDVADVVGRAHIYSNLGSLYIAQGRYDEARSALNDGLELIQRPDIEERDKLSLYANSGHLYAKQGRWQEADEMTKVALKIAQRIRLPYDEAKLTYNLGLHQARQGKLDSARPLYLLALQVGTQYGFWQVEELAQTALGRLYHQIGDYDQAIGSFERVAEIQEGLDDKAKLAGIYFDIGTFYSHKEDYEAVARYYVKGLRLLEHIKGDDAIRLFLGNVCLLSPRLAEPRRIINALNQVRRRLRSGPPSNTLGSVYGAMGRICLGVPRRTRLALVCIRGQIAVLEQLGRYQEQAETLMELGAVYEERERHKDVIDTYTRAIHLARANNMRTILGIALYNRGNCFASLEMWQGAEEDYRRSLRIGAEAGDSRSRDAATHNLGEVCRRQGRLKEARELLYASLASARQLGDIGGEVKSLNNLGLAYQGLSLETEALACFNDALRLCRQHHLIADEVNVLISLGNFHLASGTGQKAMESYQKALATAQGAEDPKLEEDSMISLASCHRQLGTFDLVTKEFVAVAERADRLGHQENLARFVTLAGEVNLEEGDTEGAADMFEQALRLGVHLLYRRIVSSPPKCLIPELVDAMGRIVVCIDQAVRGGKAAKATQFYNALMERVRKPGALAQAGPSIIAYLEPLGSYLGELPAQPLLEFLEAAWKPKRASALPSDLPTA